MSNADEQGEQREVLSSLPRSRRQRPSARREAARAARSKPGPAAKAGKTAGKGASAGTAKPRASAKPRAVAKAGAASGRTGRTKAKAKATAKPRASHKPRVTTKVPAAVPPAGKGAAPRAAKTPAVPAAGWATPRHGGSADPGAAIAGLVRGILKRLPI
jgi:hypothetical protein